MAILRKRGFWILQIFAFSKFFPKNFKNSKIKTWIWISTNFKIYNSAKIELSFFLLARRDLKRKSMHLSLYWVYRNVNKVWRWQKNNFYEAKLTCTFQKMSIYALRFLKAPSNAGLWRKTMYSLSIVLTLYFTICIFLKFLLTKNPPHCS